MIKAATQYKSFSMHIPHESSAQRTAKDRDDVAQAWKRQAQTQRQSAADGVTLQNLITQVNRLRRQTRGGGGTTASGFKWQEPKELDPTVAVAEGTFVYLSPNNPLCVTGLTDLVTDTKLRAPAGIWQAAKNVPAQDEALKYNVPQKPYPDATGTPAGSPLEGDLDGDNVFWIHWQGLAGCDGVGNVI